MPLVIICFSSSSYSLHVFLDEIPYGTKILLQQNERNRERERKRELGWEWQKVFFRLLAIWTRYVFTFFRELLLFTWIKRLLLRGCASADNDVHSFPDCCVYIKQGPETYGNVGLLSLNSVFCHSLLVRIVMRKSKIVVKDRCDQL